MCIEAACYEEKAQAARRELAAEPIWSPHMPFIRKKIDAAEAGAHKARLAHKLGKCHCFAKAAAELDRKRCET